MAARAGIVARATALSTSVATEDRTTAHRVVDEHAGQQPEEQVGHPAGCIDEADVDRVTGEHVDDEDLQGQDRDVAAERGGGRRGPHPGEPAGLA